MTDAKTPRTYLAVLSNHQLKYLFQLLGSCLAVDNIQKKAIGAALSKVESFGKMTYNLETNIHTYEPAEKTWQYEFSQKELFGIKLAIAQEVTGLGQQRLPCTEGGFRYYVVPMLKAFGNRFHDLVLKECRVKDEPEADFKMELDAPAEPPQESAIPEAPKQEMPKP